MYPGGAQLFRYRPRRYPSRILRSTQPVTATVTIGTDSFNRPLTDSLTHSLTPARQSAVSDSAFLEEKLVLLPGSYMVSR